MHSQRGSDYGAGGGVRSGGLGTGGRHRQVTERDTAAAVLYVEDDEIDVLMMRRAWERAGLSNPLHVVSDGQEAEDYLSGEGQYANRGMCPTPALVLLDLRLPKITGLDLLKWIRAQPTLRTLHVVVLSSSDLPQEVQRTKALG